MTSLPETRTRSEGTLWKEGDVFRWQIALGCETDGKRITCSGRAPSREAAQTAINKLCSERLAVIKSQNQSAGLTPSAPLTLRGYGKGSVWKEKKIYRLVIVSYTAEGQRVIHGGRSPSRSAAVQAMHKVCSPQPAQDAEGTSE